MFEVVEIVYGSVCYFDLVGFLLGEICNWLLLFVFVFEDLCVFVGCKVVIFVIGDL